MYNMDMNIAYSDKPLVVEKNSIFLAGPTPRTTDVKSWRPKAIQVLEELEYKGQVIVPERENWEGTDYLEQVEWENIGLNECAAIVFWVPRDLDTMPAFTTNVEFGRFCQDPRTLYGRPEDSPNNRYLDWLYKKFLNRRPSTLLCNLMTDAFDLATWGVIGK
jgi:hypothetical protein